MRFRPLFEQFPAVMPSAARIVQRQPRFNTACSGRKSRESPQNQRNPFIAHTAALRQAAITHTWCVAREHLAPVGGWLASRKWSRTKMINLKVMSAVAALALVLPMAAPVESHAAWRGGSGGGGMPVGGGGGGMRSFGGGGMHVGGGGGPRFSGGAGFARPSVAAPNVAAGPAAGARFSGAAVASGPRYAGSNWSGGNWRGGNWNGGWRHRRGGFWPGVAAGALVGGAIGSSYAYYGDPYYDSGYGYYDDGYYDDSTVAVVPGGGDDAASCAQRYRSYDPASGTYLGYDGQRHPCP
jgi:BA14K-like protein